MVIDENEADRVRTFLERKRAVERAGFLDRVRRDHRPVQHDLHAAPRLDGESGNAPGELQLRIAREERQTLDDRRCAHRRCRTACGKLDRRLPLQERDRGLHRREQLIEVLGWIDGSEQLVFSSDYPHWDSDEIEYVRARLPQEWQDNVFRGNAMRLYDWSEAELPEELASRVGE